MITALKTMLLPFYTMERLNLVLAILMAKVQKKTKKL